MNREALAREAKRAALTRMENAARTEDDFQEVVAQWNHRDKTRERNERRREVRRPNEEMLHWDRLDEDDRKGKMKDGLETVFPRPIEYPWWRQMIRGDFLDTMFDCPNELHELVTDKRVSKLLRDMPPNHKEILYYSAIRQYSNTRIAALRCQSDRNIRKALSLLLRNLREKLHG
jgi:DNA-directed RNA polymerase specialized sigma24 family protein